VDGRLFLGQFVVNRTGKGPDSWELTEPQVKQVAAWLFSHRSELSIIVASPPPPALSIVLKHLDGSRTQIDLFDTNESWRQTVVVHHSDASQNGTMHLDLAERRRLLEMVRRES
jgi:hypothetical protein